jgi:hypothetical protein
MIAVCFFCEIKINNEYPFSQGAECVCGGSETLFV